MCPWRAPRGLKQIRKEFSGYCTYLQDNNQCIYARIPSAQELLDTHGSKSVLVR